MANNQSFWQRLASGFLIGFGMVIPGVSGAVLAMILGLYEPIIAAIAKPFDDFSNNLKLLMPLAFGLLICILFLARVLEFLFNHYPVPTLYFFFGLVISSLPTMIKLGNAKGFRLSYIVSVVCGLLLILVMANLSGQLVEKETFQLNSNLFMVTGAILGFSLLIPGLSTSFLLIAFGLYDGLLRAVVQWDFKALFLVILGFLPTLILASKVINWLLSWKHGHVSYAIIGLTFGSLWLAFPGWPQTAFEFMLCLVLFGGGILLSSLFVRRQGA